MTLYELEFEGQLVSVARRSPSRARLAQGLEAFVDSVVVELERLDAKDIDVSTDLATGHVRVGIAVEADELPEAQAVGSGTIRTGFHAAGAATPGWRVDWVRASTVPELVDA
jgi:hypothetical protein